MPASDARRAGCTKGDYGQHKNVRSRVETPPDRCCRKGGTSARKAPVKKPSNEDRRIAHAASLELSRMLCDVSFVIRRTTRERLRRSISDDRSL